MRENVGWEREGKEWEKMLAGRGRNELRCWLGGRGGGMREDLGWEWEDVNEDEKIDWIWITAELVVTETNEHCYFRCNQPTENFDEESDIWRKLKVSRNRNVNFKSPVLILINQSPQSKTSLFPKNNHCPLSLPQKKQLQVPSKNLQFTASCTNSITSWPKFHPIP